MLLLTLLPGTFCASVQKAGKFRAAWRHARSARPSQKVYRQRSGPLHASAPSRRRPPHRGANHVEASHLLRAHQAVEFRRRIASGGSCAVSPLAVVYFLRKRSSRTTSPPPAGLSESASDRVPAGSGLAAMGTATLVCIVAVCSAGGRAASRSLPAGACSLAFPGCWASPLAPPLASASPLSFNFRPNFPPRS